MLTPKNSTWAAHKRIAIALGLSGACLALAFGLMSALGIRINTSYSLPMGIYARTGDGHTNLIEFCPEGHAAAESSERGYRTRRRLPRRRRAAFEAHRGATGRHGRNVCRRHQRKRATAPPDGSRIAGPLWQTAPGLAERTISSGRWICLGGVFI